jgi:hypothetical protein
MFTDVSEECPASVFITYDDGNAGKRRKNHIPEDYLNDKGKNGRPFFVATNCGQEG